MTKTEINLRVAAQGAWFSMSLDQTGSMKENAMKKLLKAVEASRKAQVKEELKRMAALRDKGSL